MTNTPPKPLRKAVDVIAEDLGIDFPMSSANYVAKVYKDFLVKHLIHTISIIRSYRKICKKQIKNKGEGYVSVYIQGDVLKTSAKYICHQVNTFGVMGAGVALQIKKNYPHVYLSIISFVVIILLKSSMVKFFELKKTR